MTNASRSVFLRSLGRGRAAPAVPDLADMGTAFALDEALDRAGLDTFVPSQSPAPMRAAVPVASWRLWLGRKLGA